MYKARLAYEIANIFLPKIIYTKNIARFTNSRLLRFFLYHLIYSFPNELHRLLTVIHFSAYFSFLTQNKLRRFKTELSKIPPAYKSPNIFHEEIWPFKNASIRSFSIITHFQFIYILRPFSMSLIWKRKSLKYPQPIYQKPSIFWRVTFCSAKILFSESFQRRRQRATKFSYRIKALHAETFIT